VNEQVDYVVPIEGHRSVYTDTIEALPLDQSTEVFGLHHNADISYYTNATKQIWRDMVDLQPRTGSTAGGITREEFIGNVAKDIQARLPEPFDLPMLKKEMPSPTPTQVVLFQEIARWNMLVIKMRISLRDLQVTILHPHSAFCRVLFISLGCLVCLLFTTPLLTKTLPFAEIRREPLLVKSGSRRSSRKFPTLCSTVCGQSSIRALTRCWRAGLHGFTDVISSTKTWERLESRCSCGSAVCTSQRHTLLRWCR
jgi:hypothetical protein